MEKERRQLNSGQGALKLQPKIKLVGEVCYISKISIFMKALTALCINIYI